MVEGGLYRPATATSVDGLLTVVAGNRENDELQSQDDMISRFREALLRSVCQSPPDMAA